MEGAWRERASEGKGMRGRGGILGRGNNEGEDI